MKMNKTLLSAGIAMSLGLGASSAQAVFTQMGAGNYKATITGGCFTFGTCSDTGTGAFTDNTASQATTTVTAAIGNTTRSVGDTIGSGTVGGDNGEISFSLDASGNMTVTAYRQDSYLATAGGTFFVDALTPAATSNMTGSIDALGNMAFTPSDRVGTAYLFWTGIGSQPWNIIPDDSVTTETAFDSFSTGTESAAKGKATLSMTGTPLADTGTPLEWSGVIVSAGNVNGQYWAGFDNTLYTEQFNLTIVCTDTGAGACAPAVIPVPAAVWLFGSGLLGLVGVARRRRNS